MSYLAKATLLITAMLFLAVLVSITSGWFGVPYTVGGATIFVLEVERFKVF